MTPSPVRWLPDGGLLMDSGRIAKPWTNPGFVEWLGSPQAAVSNSGQRRA